MKVIHAALLVLPTLATLGCAGAAYANADDVKWINQCVADNQDQHQTTRTVRVYCTCMDNLMSSSETRSITQWEKTHVKEQNFCGDKAGWVGR